MKCSIEGRGADYLILCIIDSTDTELAAHAFSLFIEGFETSSTVMSFLLYELARNPEIQERVHDEIVEVLARHNNKFSYDALQEMVYLERVIHGEYQLL